ncbi:hypothetical protein MA16_Dca004488 [Dendrobium catenatum]|uniref:Uncharacterized protein n=1 Tax=Dendrobium catenatum TaxID=906689 RepID=A0A2I0W7L0_9ASPA|nr:hypothetical protein MA16_Dca004488 [Dendrobium catenatum]
MYGERRGHAGYEQRGFYWERRDENYGRRCADFDRRRGEMEEGFGSWKLLRRVSGVLQWSINVLILSTWSTSISIAFPSYRLLAGKGSDQGYCTILKSARIVETSEEKEEEKLCLLILGVDQWWKHASNDSKYERKLAQINSKGKWPK